MQGAPGAQGPAGAGADAYVSPLTSVLAPTDEVTTIGSITLTGGRPVLLLWHVHLTATTTNLADAHVQLLLDGTPVATQFIRALGTAGGVGYSHHVVQDVPAGTHTYSLELSFTPGAVSPSFLADPIRFTAIALGSLTP